MTKMLYFEDLAEGSEYRFGDAGVDTASIKAFAKRYDPQPFHLDEAAARDSVFQGLAASGWHTVSLAIQALHADPEQRIASQDSPGFDNLRWLKPVRPGDKLSVKAACLDKQDSSEDGHGTVRLAIETANHADETVMRMELVLTVSRRPG